MSIADAKPRLALSWARIARIPERLALVFRARPKRVPYSREEIERLRLDHELRRAHVALIGHLKVM